MAGKESFSHLVELKARLFLFAVFTILSLFALRLGYLQLSKGDYYQFLSQNNSRRQVATIPPRGIIVDRRGRVLAGNALRPMLAISRRTAANLSEKDLDNLLAPLGYGLTGKACKEALTLSPLDPVPLARNIEPDLAARVEAMQAELPFLSVEFERIREYTGPDSLAHLLGYTGEATQRDLEQQELPLLALGDRVGRTGVEKMYQHALMGSKGKRTFWVNSLGVEIPPPPGTDLPEGDQLPAEAGSRLVLSLDLDLQRLVEASFGEEKGAAVFLDPRNGEILAMVSKPGFDPNLFSGGIRSEDWKALTSDPQRPLQNRTIQGAYPPGSVFKVMMSIAGLEEGVITPDTVISCNGGKEFYGRRFRCWNAGGHGSITLETALEKSCNVYFYTVGNRLGIDRIHHWGEQFGFGSPTGLDLPGERRGILPSAPWKQERFGVPWYPGETISVSIGQGYLSFTPMQVARFMAAVGNGGYVPTPHLALNDSNSRGYTVAMKEENLEAVKEAMWQVVQGEGTARRLRVEGLDICAKTGTAQVVAASAGVDAKKLDKSIRDHAWLSGFAPRDNPEVAFAIIVEHGGHGGDTAAPIARDALDLLFNRGETAPDLAPENQPEPPPAPGDL